MHLELTNVKFRYVNIHIQKVLGQCTNGKICRIRYVNQNSCPENMKNVKKELTLLDSLHSSNSPQGLLQRVHSPFGNSPYIHSHCPC